MISGAPSAYRGGYLSMYAGASATGIALTREAYLFMEVDRNTLLQAIDNAGSAYNVSNGLFSDLTVSSRFQVRITSGASAANIINSGLFEVYGSAVNITNTYNYSGCMTIGSGGRVSGAAGVTVKRTLLLLITLVPAFNSAGGRRYSPLLSARRAKPKRS